MLYNFSKYNEISHVIDNTSRLNDILLLYVGMSGLPTPADVQGQCKWKKLIKISISKIKLLPPENLYLPSTQNQNIY